MQEHVIPESLTKSSKALRSSNIFSPSTIASTALTWSQDVQWCLDQREPRVSKKIFCQSVDKIQKN